MMKRVLALLLALVMVFTFAACGEKKQEEKKDEFDPSIYQLKEDEAVEFEFWHNYSNAKREAWLQARADEFMAEHKNVKITLVCTGGHPATREAVAGALSAGTGLCALSTINAPQVQVYATNAVAEPLDDYFKAYGVSTDSYYTGLLDAAKYDADGKLYGMPFGASAGSCYYNKTVTEAAGAKIPETWDEFKDWCKTVSEYTGYPAFGFAYDFNYLNTFFLNVTGKDPLGDGKTSQLDDPSMLAFVKEMKELCDKGYATLMGVKIDSASNDQLAAFQSQQIAGFTSTSSDAVKAYQAGVDGGFEVDYRVGVSNNGKPAISTASGAYAVVYADQSTQMQKNAAVQFLIYILDRQSEFAADTMMFPVKTDADMSKTFEKYPGCEAIFGNVDKIITKNKVSCMQKAMTEVAGVLASIVRGDTPEDQIDASWATLKKAVDQMLADAQ